MINVDDVQAGVKELERCAKMGLAGGMITVYTPEERPYHLREYGLLWSAAEDLGWPLDLHIATDYPSPGQKIGVGEERQRIRPSFIM